MSDLDWLREKDNARMAEEARLLTDAKAKAKRDGKEPFDFDRLAQMYDVAGIHNRKLHDRQSAEASLESKYYLRYPNVKTIEEFARVMTETDMY